MKEAKKYAQALKDVKYACTVTKKNLLKFRSEHGNTGGIQS